MRARWAHPLGLYALVTEGAPLECRKHFFEQNCSLLDLLNQFWWCCCVTSALYRHKQSLMRLAIEQDGQGGHVRVRPCGLGWAVSSGPGRNECCQLAGPSGSSWLWLPSPCWKGKAVRVSLLCAGACNEQSNPSCWRFLFQLLLWQIVSLLKFSPSISVSVVCVFVCVF